MKVLLVLVPISIALLGVAIWAFAWAVRKGQFDDLDTPALNILADDPPTKPAPVTEREDRGGDHDPPPASGDVVASGSDESAEPRCRST